MTNKLGSAQSARLEAERSQAPATQPRRARFALSYWRALLGLILVFAWARAADTNLTNQYRATADRLIDAALADQEGYAKLAYLCDRIGNRLSGPESLEKAIARASGQMNRDELTNVRV